MLLSLFSLHVKLLVASNCSIPSIFWRCEILRNLLSISNGLQWKKMEFTKYFVSNDRRTLRWPFKGDVHQLGVRDPQWFDFLTLVRSGDFVTLRSHGLRSLIKFKKHTKTVPHIRRPLSKSVVIFHSSHLYML